MLNFLYQPSGYENRLAFSTKVEMRRLWRSDAAGVSSANPTMTLEG